MKRTDRNTINNILHIRKHIYGLQDILDDEQDELIGDLVMPTAKLVEKLVALDNKRIDLCNLKVLYAFIERELGDEFRMLVSVAASGGDSALYDRAARAVELAGYTVKRAARDFEYIFALFGKRKNKNRDMPFAAVFGNDVVTV